jgi:hypothetical protein
MSWFVTCSVHLEGVGVACKMGGNVVGVVFEES